MTDEEIKKELDRQHWEHRAQVEAEDAARADEAEFDVELDKHLTNQTTENQ